MQVRKRGVFRRVRRERGGWGKGRGCRFHRSHFADVFIRKYFKLDITSLRSKGWECDLVSYADIRKESSTHQLGIKTPDLS